MKKLFTLFTFLVFTHFFGLSQNNVSWNWTRVFTGTGNNSTNSIKVDSLDNVFVLGSFADSLFIGNDTIVSRGSNDVYLAKLNKQGELLWYKQLGTSNNDDPGSLTIDKQGNVYLFAFGSEGDYYIGGQDTISASKTFILKISPSGSVLGKKTVDGTIRKVINIQTDKNNNIYGAVDIADTLLIADSILVMPSFVGSCYSAFFKLDEGLTCTWIKESFPFMMGFGAMSNFKTDDEGNVYVALSLGGTIDFGDGVQVIVPPTTMYANVLAKYNTNKQCLWAKQLVYSPGAFSESFNISLDKSNGVYMSGMSLGTTYIGDSIFYDDAFEQMENGYIIRLDTAGNFKFARSFHGNLNGGDFCVDFASGQNEWGYLLGAFNDTLFIGNDTLYGSHTDLATSSYIANSAFISKIDTSGNIIKSFYAGEIGKGSLCTNSLGDLFVAGYNLPSGAKSIQDSYKSFFAGLLAPVAPTIELATDDTICLGSTIGDLGLPLGLTVLKWQKTNNNQAWVDINSTSVNYSETPLVTGLWSYRAEVQFAGYSPLYTTPIDIYVITRPVSSFTHELNGLDLFCTNTTLNSDSSVWIWGDGTRTETTQNAASHVYSENNQYSVTLISYNQCGNDSTTVAVAIAQGVNSYTNHPKIECFPNPTSGLVNVKVSKFSLNCPIKAKIVSLIGEVLLESSLSKETSVIDLKSLPKGIYYLVLEGDRITQTEKIIKL